jgi:hypothetical protein
MLADQCPAPLKPKKITAQLEQIYQANKDSQDREIVAAASVISTLIGRYKAAEHLS